MPQNNIALSINFVTLKGDNMPRQSKIEKHGLEDKVLDLRNKGKSLNDIVKILKTENKITLSNMSVQRWLEKHEYKVDEKAVEVIKEDKRRVVKSINKTYDIIQTQLDVSQRVLDKLNVIDDIETVIEEKTKAAIYLMQNMGRNITPEEFAQNIEKNISKNISDYTKLTKEIRENNKFLSDLKEKIYDFQIVQEFIQIFIDEFAKKNKDITSEVLEELSNNSRLKWLADKFDSRSEEGAK
ncbi:MAG: hypothetical protein FH761_16655 [Firmicutes bacterium]|nr:hypothetical protein [Bacillota bacterium]